MALPKYTKWKIVLDILSLIFLLIFIGAIAYDPKIHNLNGDFTFSGKVILLDILPFLAGGLWLVFRIVTSNYADIIGNWLPFRLLGKLCQLLIPIIYLIILFSLITKKG